MRIFSLLIVGVIVASSNGCIIAYLMNNAVPGSGVSATETREIEDFYAIEFAGSGDVTVVCGQEPSLVVTTDDNLMELYRTEVENGVLKIYPFEPTRPTVGPTFEISTSQLRKVEIAGSCRFDVAGLDVPEFEYSVAGSGQLSGSGQADVVSIEVAGSGKFNLDEVAAKDVSVEIAGSGSGVVQAQDNLKVEIAGSGRIEYIGSPKVKKSVAGSGKVTQIAEGPAESAPAEAIPSESN